MSGLNGRFFLDRKLLSWEWFDDSKVLHVWIYILIRANWCPDDWHGIHLERGQFFTSYGTIAKATGLSNKEVRTAISKLKKTGEISTSRAGNGQIITVEKYDEYQSHQSKSGRLSADDGQTSGRHRADQGQQMNNINNNNKDNKENKVSSREVLDIVTYLNERLGTHYRASTKKTQKDITDRLKEGFTVDDFKVVIDKKADEWLGDPKMEKFLRPETLFSNKFEGYLNQPVTKKVNVFDIEF